VNDHEIHEALTGVKDATTFIAFLEALRASWNTAVLEERNNSSMPYISVHGWENTSIVSFLDAAIAGGTDHEFERTTNEDGEASAWQTAAKIILLGKIYE
jgi:hypothetical protein